MTTRLPLDLTQLQETPWRGDPDAQADRADLRSAESARSARSIALDMAKKGAVSAELLAGSALCTVDTAHTTLSNLRAEGRLTRFARGWYALPGKTKAPERQGGMVSAARADRKEKEAHLSAAEAFLADRAQWPGGPAELPKHTPAPFDLPVMRRRRV
jgi:hypothetical protein